MTGVLESTWSWAYGAGCETLDGAPGEDRRVVQCNYTAATRIAATGARAYLVRPNPGGGDDRIVVLVRSRGGRLVEKWEDIRNLGNFRVKTLPPGHPRYGDERIWDHEPDAMAARLADRSAAA